MVTCVGAVVLVVVTGWTLANDFVDGLAHHDESSTQTMRPVDAVAPAAQFGLVAFAAFVMLGVTSEYTGDTIRTTLRVVPKRWPMLVVIATVGATVTAVAGFAAVVVSGVLVKQCCTAPRSRAVDAGTGRLAALIIALDGILVAGIAAIVRNSVATLFATNPAARGDFGASGARVGLDPVRGCRSAAGRRSQPLPACVGAVVLTGWAVMGVPSNLSRPARRRSSRRALRDTPRSVNQRVSQKHAACFRPRD